jgi:hypothetical protein
MWSPPWSGTSKGNRPANHRTACCRTHSELEAGKRLSIRRGRKPGAWCSGQWHLHQSIVGDRSL